MCRWHSPQLENQLLHMIVGLRHLQLCINWSGEKDARDTEQISESRLLNAIGCESWFRDRPSTILRRREDRERGPRRLASTPGARRGTFS